MKTNNATSYNTPEPQSRVLYLHLDRRTKHHQKGEGFNREEIWMYKKY
jgi:hypothetical protein